MLKYFSIISALSADKEIEDSRLRFTSKNMFHNFTKQENVFTKQLIKDYEGKLCREKTMN